MTRARTTLIALIAAVGLVVAGCGSSSDPLDTSGAGDSAAETPSSPSDNSGSGSTDDTSSESADSGQEGSDANDADDSADDATEPEDTDADDSAADSTGDTEESAPIVIGSANFTESKLVAEIYAAALRAAGVDVQTHLNIGSREIYLQAIEDGSITLLPEYTGGLLAYYAPDSTATSSEDVYADLEKAIPDDLEVLEYSPAQDQDSVTVTAETAEKYDLETIGDLAPVAGDMVLGGSPEWQTRADGPEGLKKVYGVEFSDYKVLDPGGPLSVKGLKTGLVDATDIFTTNPAIEKNNFVVLGDPKSLFLAQNVVPLISDDADSDTVVKALNAVSAALTTKDLTSMLATINAEKADPAKIAEQWVAENGLG